MLTKTNETNSNTYLGLRMWGEMRFATVSSRPHIRRMLQYSYCVHRAGNARLRVTVMKYRCKIGQQFLTHCSHFASARVLNFSNPVKHDFWYILLHFFFRIVCLFVSWQDVHTRRVKAYVTFPSVLLVLQQHVSLQRAHIFTLTSAYDDFSRYFVCLLLFTHITQLHL